MEQLVFKQQRALLVLRRMTSRRRRKNEDRYFSILTNRQPGELPALIVQ